MKSLKFSAFILSLALGISFFSGCGDDAEEQTGNPLCKASCEKFDQCGMMTYDSVEICEGTCIEFFEDERGNCEATCDTSLDCQTYEECLDGCSGLRGLTITIISLPPVEDEEESNQ